MEDSTAKKGCQGWKSQKKESSANFLQKYKISIRRGRVFGIDNRKKEWYDIFASVSYS
ncbi:hypothetical protein I4200191B4_07290 [Pseudoflavonifractor gallinarum]